MLRRRIFSSAMASVMALSSVAVVANAEDAQYKSKADLEKLVYETYGESFRNGALGDYGTFSAENVLDALEAADAILADSDSDEDDYTAAYKMVEATVARLTIYTAEELKALIDSCRSIVESNNIYNEDLGDLIYTDTSYDALYTAYGEAEAVVDSASSADITDAYESLNNAKTNLVKMAVVSKSMFRNILKEYEALISNEYKYESWRLGEVTGWADLNSNNYWAYQGKPMAYGLMLDSVLSVKNYINEQYMALDNIKTLTKTSADDIVAAYKCAQDAVAIAKGWTVDNTNRATKSGVKNLLDQYHGSMVYEFNATSAEALYDLIVAEDAKVLVEAVDWADGTTDFVANSEIAARKYKMWNVNEVTATLLNGWQTEQRIHDASLTIKPSVKLYIPIKDGVWTGAKPLTTAPADYKSTTYKLVSANTKYDITALIPVTSDMVVGVADTLDANVPSAGAKPGSDTDCKFTTTAEFPAFTGYTTPAANDYGRSFEQAFKLAEDYLNEKYAGISAIDDAGVVVTAPSGTSKEWALVYRNLYYAIQDRYEGNVGDKYTKNDVKALIDKAYDIAELTGDAAIFSTAHKAVVDARQTAIEWLRMANSDKKYKDYNAGMSSADEFYPDSTTAYKKLFDEVDQLEKEYNAMKYSFGDIYDRIAEVSAMIDDGDLEATSDLLTALDNTAYYLSVVNDTIYTATNSWDACTNPYEENAAFTVDREFMAYNRLITTGDNVKIESIGEHVRIKSPADGGDNVTHYNLYTAFMALEAAIEAQTAPAALLGDVDGNGTVNALDASALLVNTVNGVTMDAAVADYDKNGSINALDASAILIAIVNGTV